MAQIYKDKIDFLFHYWKSYCTSLSVNTLKEYGLITLNAFAQSAPLFFIYFGWVFIAREIVSWLIPCNQYAIAFMYLVAFVCTVLVWFGIFLTIRPSIRLKTSQYFLFYRGHFFKFLCAIGALLLVQASALAISGYFAVPFKLFLLFDTPHDFFALPSPFLLFFGYFFLDTDGSTRNIGNSAVRAFTMLLYMFPFACVSIAIFGTVGFILELLMGIALCFIPHLLWHIIAVLVVSTYWIIIACWFNTIYIKKIHEDYDLFM
jgi:hypothetical protein